MTWVDWHDLEDEARRKARRLHRRPRTLPTEAEREQQAEDDDLRHTTRDDAADPGWADPPTV